MYIRSKCFKCTFCLAVNPKKDKSFKDLIYHDHVKTLVSTGPSVHLLLFD